MVSMPSTGAAIEQKMTVSTNSPARVERIMRSHRKRPLVAFFMDTIIQAFRVWPHR